MTDIIPFRSKAVREVAKAVDQDVADWCARFAAKITRIDAAIAEAKRLDLAKDETVPLWVARGLLEAVEWLKSIRPYPAATLLARLKDEARLDP